MLETFIMQVRKRVYENANSYMLYFVKRTEYRI